MTMLLDKIITHTALEEPNEAAVWVRNNTDFLSVAKISSTEPADVKPKNNREQYFFGIFRELLKELKFFYEQFKAIQEIGLPEDKTRHINHRLEIILSSIEESFPVTRPWFWELIDSNMSPDLEIAIFAVSCFAKDDDLNKDSSRLFESFAACSPETIRSFVSSFKHSKSREINKKLAQVANSTIRAEIKEACKKIILYRQDKIYKIGHHIKTKAKLSQPVNLLSKL